jgi:pyruvate ferredoxin oxidoreductase gamma subunit
MHPECGKIVVGTAAAVNMDDTGSYSTHLVWKETGVCYSIATISAPEHCFALLCQINCYNGKGWVKITLLCSASRCCTGNKKRRFTNMKNGIEIRWHGRGGQGAKTAALLLADVAFKTGANVQGFPEYGPERMGAPITAYNRISKDVIRVHSNIYTPDLVVVVDETLLESVDVTAGLKEDGALIVNTPLSVEEIRPHLKGYKGNVYTVDGRKISVEALGKYFPNSPMLAAAVAVSGVMDWEQFMSEMRASYQHKFAKKPEVIDGNMKALSMTYEALKGSLEGKPKLIEAISA